MPALLGTRTITTSGRTLTASGEVADLPLGLSAGSVFQPHPPIAWEEDEDDDEDEDVLDDEEDLDLGEEDEDFFDDDEDDDDVDGDEEDLEEE